MWADFANVLIEKKKQALLNRFSPYQQQDISCRRIVQYLESSWVDTTVIEKMRQKLEDIRASRVWKQDTYLKHIQDREQQQFITEEQQAELLLTTL
jgi:hypothetical protein